MSASTIRAPQIITEAVAADMANPLFEDAQYRILIVRLSPFRDVESSYTHLVLFDETRRALPKAYIDFAFMPNLPHRKALSMENRPWFFGRASNRNAIEFNMLLISCAFSLELLNIPWLLTQSGIPFSRQERLKKEEQPFLFLGGSSAVCSGSLVKIGDNKVIDSIVDAMFFGEGEGRISEIVRIAAEDSKTGLSKPSIIAHIASEVEGFWPCDSSFVCTRALFAQRPAVLTSPIMLNSENADSIKLAITAGCIGHCTFCLEGWDRRPFIEKPVEDLSKSAIMLKRASGASDVELFSYNFNMHKHIIQLIQIFGRYFMHVSMMSQRLDILSKKPEILIAELAAGKRSFTLGIEGISERIRNYYQKGISEKQIWTSIAKILENRAREIKLFFIISGFENGSDLEEFEHFCDRLAHHKIETHSVTRIIVSAGYLVRLPFTPLQFAPLQGDRALMESIASALCNSCKQANLEFRLASSFEDYWMDQLLSLGGTIANDWLQTCPENGFIYDLHVSTRASKSLCAYFEKQSCFSQLLQEKPHTYRPNFYFIESDRHWEMLAALYDQSLDYLNYRNHRNLYTEKQADSSISLEAKKTIEIIEAQQEAKAHFPSILVKISESDALAFSTPAYERTWLLRTLSTLVPNSERGLFYCNLQLPNYGWGSAIPISPTSMVCKSRVGLSGLKYFAIYGPDKTNMKKVMNLAAMALKNARGVGSILNSDSYSGSTAFLEDIEVIQELPKAEVCRLSFCIPANKSRLINEALEKWLYESNLHFTLKKDGTSIIYHTSSVYNTNRALRYIKYKTISTNLCLSLCIGKKANLSLLADILYKKCAIEKTIFRIDGWDLNAIDLDDLGPV